MLLLSMLVVVVAAMPAMATGPSRFYWTGNAGTNLWESARNWSADVALLSSDVSSDVSTTEYYPGNVKMNQKVKSLDVVISKDAAITVNQGLAGVLGISIDAKVTLDLGGYGYFVTVPNIKVDSGDFTLKGTRVLDIANNATWQGNKPITLDLNVLPAINSKLTLSIDNAALTINNATLLRNTDIVVSGEKGVLVLNVSPETSTTISDATTLTTTNAPRRDLSIQLLNNAKIEVPADVSVTIDANRNKWNYGPVISGDLIKTGAGTLTLTRATPTASYDVVISSDVKKITVEAGTLEFTGTSAITPASIDFAVAAGAKLVVGSSQAVNTNKAVRLTVSGDAEIAANGIGTSTSLYSSSTHQLALSGYNLSADVRKGGTLTFSGTQPIKGLKGAGTVVASNGTLMLDATSKDIEDFTGELQASIVGLNKSFDDLPFANASSDISAVHVYGGAELKLDAAKLASVSGMEQLGVYLRSNYDSVAGTYLSSNTVGVLHISGDITIGTLTADGSKNTPATVTFASADKLTVSKLVLHANKTLDSSTQPTYSGVHAILISGDGTFNPKAVENAADDANLGSERAIEVTGGATLKLEAGVNIPAGNSLMLTGGTLEAANGLTIPVDLTIDQQSAPYNVIKTTVVADNVRLYEGGHNAINVGGSFTLKGVASFDISLNDDNQSIGRKYRIIGPRADNFTKVVSEDASVDVVPAKKATMHADFDTNGVYVILDALMLQPRLLAEEWTVSKVRDIDFEAKVSYDIPANVVPAGLINLVSVRVDIAENSFDNAGVTRQAVKGSDGKDLVYISSLKANSRDKEIVLVGTLYADELETKITLGWNKTTLSKDWIAYQKAGITYNGMDVDSRDFVAAETVTMKKFSNPKQETPTPTPGDGELSEDVIATDVVPEVNVHTVTAGSQDVVLTVTGIRRLLTGSNSFVPVLVNGTYVWMNGYDPATEKFEMLYDGTYRPVSLDIKINGVSVNMASVDIAGSEPVTITVPAEFFTTTLAYTAPQEVVIVGTTANGHTITTEPISVWVKPASGYQAGTIDAGYVGRGTSDTEVTRRVADIPLGGTISFDVTGGTMPDEWLDADGIAAGVISFTVPAGTAAGVYTKTIDVYTAEGGYTYTFSYEVVEGLKINDPDEPYGSIGGLNYEAHFTTNAPAGTVVEWALTTKPEWLKFAHSDDVFVVYGQLPAYVDDDEAEDDPNEYAYTVTATVSGDTRTKEWTISVEEDTDEVVDHTQFTAGEITFPEGKDIVSADSTYSVDISFNADNYGSEIEFSIPYWLVATPKTAVVDGEEVITGYTITYKEGAAVTAGETGVVRFEDPDSGNIISWPVTFNETIQPTPPDAFTLTTDSSVSLTLGTATAYTKTLTLTTANALGTVSYDYTVTPDNGGLTVALSGNQATLTGATAGTYTVVFTATDAARATDNTATFTTTVTVSGGVTPGPQPGALVITATPNTLTFAAGSNLVQTVTLEATVDGVSYTSDKEWAVVEENRVMVSTPEESDVITITGTAPDGQSADVTITVTVTGGSQDTFTLTTDSTVSLTLGTETAYRTTLTLTPANAVGTVSYSYTVTPDNGGLTVALSGNQATLTGVTAGTYTVVFTATDSEGNTATANTTVTVSGGVVDNTFRIERRFASYSFDISAGIVSFDVNAVVRPVNNQGAVTYTASVSPTNGLSIAVSGNVVVLGATSTGTYTVTVTGTDTATSQTATTTITVVVTSRGSLGSSGGGCDAGFGALALALAVPLFLRRRRS